MAKPHLDRHRAARVIVDAISLGSDQAAADKHGISLKTVTRYRARVHEDDELARVVQKLGAKADVGWQVARTRFLCEIVDGLRDGIIKTRDANGGVMTPDMMQAVSEAIERVGKLDVAAKALNVGSDADPGDPEPATDAGDADEGESLGEELPH